MPQRWSSIKLSFILTLSAASLFLGSCKKQMSTDTPLASSYYPSVIINEDNQVVYALNPSNGAKNWQFGMPVPTGYSSLVPTVPIVFNPSPLLYNGSVYVAYSQHDPTKTDYIYKLNGQTGALITKISPNPNEIFNIQATPIANANLLYVAGAGVNNKLYAIDTGTYVTKWEYSADGPIISSPTLYGNNLYFATTTGTIYCIDATLGPTGTTNWQYSPVDSPNTAIKASFYSSPAISAPYLYIGSVSDSNMYCISLTNPPTGSLIAFNANPPKWETERWRYKTQGPIYSSPALYAGTCIFGSNDYNVYCLDTAINPTAPIDPYSTPRNLNGWPIHLNNIVRSSPYVYNQTVYVACDDYNLYALNILGTVKWSFASKGLIKSSPIVYNGEVYIGSYDMYMYALDTAYGNIQWSWNTNGAIQDAPVINDLTGNSFNSGISGYCNGGVGTGYFYNFNANNF